MKRIFMNVPALALLLTVVSIGLADKPTSAGKPPADTPVTTTVRDADANIAPVLQIRSDGGLYSNTKDVQSLIQGIGDWVMQSDYSTTSTRTVFVDFSQPIAGSCLTCPNGNPVVLPSRSYPTRFIAKCHEYYNNMFTLSYLSTISCPLYTRVDVNGQNYRINMNPLSGAQAYYPETNYVNITCTRLNSSGQCNSWQVEPSGTYVPAGGTVSVRGNAGKLVKVVTVRGKTTDIDQGDFYFSFSIGVTNP
ncbi:MAG TPA: hypothetical protein VIF81_11190 [Pyrinomonadaceae bacterium]